MKFKSFKDYLHFFHIPFVENKDLKNVISNRYMENYTFVCFADDKLIETKTVRMGINFKLLMKV